MIINSLQLTIGTSLLYLFFCQILAIFKFDFACSLEFVYFFLVSIEIWKLCHSVFIYPIIVYTWLSSAEHDLKSFSWKVCLGVFSMVTKVEPSDLLRNFLFQLLKSSVKTCFLFSIILDDSIL